MSSSASKISLYSLSDLKTTLDDHIPIYLSTSSTPSSAPLSRHLRFTPSQTHTYIRLGLGYSAVVIALYIFYLDYIQKVDFREIKTLTAWSVVAYFALNGALQAWIWFGEKGLIFVGERWTELTTPASPESLEGRRRRSHSRIELYSLAPHKKYDPIYRLSVHWFDATADVTASVGKQKDEGPAAAKEASLATIKAIKEGTTNEHGKIELEAPLMQFFTQDGYFAPAAFEEWLKREIPLIEGKAPPKSGTKITGVHKRPASSSVSISTASTHTTGSPSFRNKSDGGEDEEDIVLVDSTTITGDSISSSSSSNKKKSPRKRA